MMPAPFDAASKATTREALDLLLAGVARQSTPPLRKDRAALAKARRILDENEPRKLLPLFASSGPELARALCEGTHIDGEGLLVIGKAVTNATRVGIRGRAPAPRNAPRSRP